MNSEDSVYPCQKCLLGLLVKRADPKKKNKIHYRKPAALYIQACNRRGAKRHENPSGKTRQKQQQRQQQQRPGEMLNLSIANGRECAVYTYNVIAGSARALVYIREEREREEGRVKVAFFTSRSVFALGKFVYSIIGLD